MVWTTFLQLVNRTWDYSFKSIIESKAKDSWTGPEMTIQEQDLRKTIFFKGQKNRTQKSDSCAILSPYRQILDDFHLT